MSSNVSLPQTTIVWDEKTVLENGIWFLNNKKDELHIYQDLWNTSMEVDYYTNSSKTAAEKFKATAEKSRKEIEILDRSVTQLLDVELAKNPLSEKAKYFSKIALASHRGLNYFTSVVEDTYYPTHLNWGFREAAVASNKLTLSATVLTGAAYLVSKITSYELHSYFSIPWKISMVAFITFNATRYLNTSFRVNPADEKVKSLKRAFEQAIAPDVIAATT